MNSRIAIRLVPAAIVVLAMAGCGGGTPYPSTIIQPDFQFSASAVTASATTLQAAATVAIPVSSIAGYSQPVALSVTSTNPAFTWAFQPSTVTPTAGGASSILTLTSTSGTLAAGTYSVTVTGASGKLTHSVTVMLTVTVPRDFVLAVSSAQTALVGGTATYTVTVSTTTGYGSAITLAASSLPTGCTAHFSPASVAPTASGATSTLTVTTTNGTATPGAYTFQISGSGGVGSPIGASLTLTGFTVQVTPSLQTLSFANQPTVTYAVVVTPQSGFTGTVSLALTGIPSSVTGSLSPTSVTIASGDTSASSTLTLIYNATSAVTGTYPFTVTGTSGTASTTGSATVEVTY